MYSGYRLIAGLLGVIFFTGAVIFAFDFLNIGFDKYGSYLIWFIALVIFWVFLPETGSDIFNLSDN
tara:strand:- start:1178 stop:1375 length:198 start_codon:yes stop_codon:yes gene_type:complete